MLTRGCAAFPAALKKWYSC